MNCHLIHRPFGDFAGGRCRIEGTPRYPTPALCDDQWSSDQPGSGRISCDTETTAPSSAILANLMSIGQAPEANPLASKSRKASFSNL